QHPDGYLNTYYTLVEPKNRWKNIRHGHELYCAGHLIEAAVAYQQATGKGELLGVARKLADHIDRTFGPGKRRETSGHEEIELALWNHRLFLMTGDGKYADVLEREVYNGLLSGVSLGGDRFFYVNPLGSVGRHHRVPWFGTSCCPTNLVRYLPAMGERVWARRG